MINGYVIVEVQGMCCGVCDSKNKRMHTNRIAQRTVCSAQHTVHIGSDRKQFNTPQRSIIPESALSAV